VAAPTDTLDPAHARAQAAGAAKLPERFRQRIAEQTFKFGFTPDFEALRPADIVLARSRSMFDFGGLLTAHGQRRKGVGARHAFWSHAALYLGNNRVVEAMPPSIRIWNLSDYTPSHFLMFRRYAPPRAGGELSDAERLDVCMEACSRVGKPYARRQVLEIARDAILAPKAKPLDVRTDDEFICSHLIFESFFFAIGASLATPVAASLVRPADLAASPALTTLQIGWRPIN
jgi:hypothetical protein